MTRPETNEADAASDGDASDDKRSNYVPLYPQRWKGHAAADVGLRRCGAVELSETASPGWRHHVQVQSTWAALVALDMRRSLGGCSRAVRALLSSAALARATERYLVASEDAPSAATLRAATQAGDQCSRLVARAWELARADHAHRRQQQATSGQATDARTVVVWGDAGAGTGERGGTVGGGGARPPGGNDGCDTPSSTDERETLSASEREAEAEAASEAVGELSVLMGHGLLEEGEEG